MSLSRLSNRIGRLERRAGPGDLSPGELARLERLLYRLVYETNVLDASVAFAQKHKVGGSSKKADAKASVLALAKRVLSDPAHEERHRLIEALRRRRDGILANDPKLAAAWGLTP